jgi:hypothetical protein
MILRTTPWVCLVLALPACSDTQLGHSSFWCGSTLCEWEVEQGSIGQAPTWHEKDYGVTLGDAPTVISRRTTLNSSDCARFFLLGNVDAGAELVLELDVYDEGPIEFEQPIPELHWQSQSFVLPRVDLEFSDRWGVIPASLRLHKHGAGNVVLAQLGIGWFSCPEAAPIAIADVPTGQFCMSSDQCRRGRCGPVTWKNAQGEPLGPGVDITACSDCAFDSECGDGGRCITETQQLLELTGQYSYGKCAAR